jgi:predicted porin
MKKTLIASAIAATTLSTGAFAMDQASDLAAKLNSMPTVYGNVQLVNVTEDDGDDSNSNFKDNGSTIGFKHKHAVSDSLTGFVKVEFEFAADDKDSSQGINKLDEAYIGLKGDFGSAQIGSDDTVYEWVDMIDTDEAVGISGELAKDKEGDNFQYVSPAIVDGLKLGLTLPLDSNSNFGGALAAKYAVDNLEVVLAYALGREEGGKEVGDAMGLAASFAIDELTLIAQYETLSEGASGAEDGKDTLGLLGVYKMGQNSFALGYQMTSFDPSGKEDQSDIWLQAIHNLSDNTYVYLEYLMQSDLKGTADANKDTLAIGATYAF